MGCSLPDSQGKKRTQGTAKSMKDEKLKVGGMLYLNMGREEWDRTGRPSWVQGISLDLSLPWGKNTCFICLCVSASGTHPGRETLWLNWVLKRSWWLTPVWWMGWKTERLESRRLVWRVFVYTQLQMMRFVAHHLQHSGLEEPGEQLKDTKEEE